MPSPYNYLIIVPNDDLSGVNAALGINLDVPVYLESDPTPRDPWGCWLNTSFTDALFAAIETPDTGARAVFTACEFIKWHKQNWSDPQWPRINPTAKLAEFGLTPSAT